MEKEPITYTNRELGLLINKLEEKFDTYHVETVGKLDSIEAHVMKTNGRVTKLEYKWAYLAGVVGFIIVAVPIIISAYK